MKVQQQHIPGRISIPELLAGPLLLFSAFTSHAEFRLPASEGDQTQPVVASDPRGGIVVVWRESFRDAAQPLNAIRLQRFDPSGKPLGTNTRVDLLPGDNARNPAIDVAADGSCVVVWEGGASEGPYRRTVLARIFGPDGKPRGSELQVSSHRLFAERFGISDRRYGRPAVSIDPRGGFVVAWRDDGEASCNRANIIARRFDARGGRIGEPFRVNPNPRFTNVFPEVEHDAKGNFVVVWQQTALIGTADDRSVLLGRRFNADGSADIVFTVQGGAGLAVAPSLAVAADGSFVVAWLDTRQATRRRMIAARRFSAKTTRGPLVEISEIGLSSSSFPSIVAMHDRTFALTWLAKDTDRWVGERPWLQILSATATPRRALAPVGPATSSYRQSPSLATLPEGAVAITWQASHGIEGIRIDSSGNEITTTSLQPTIAQEWPKMVSILRQAPEPLRRAGAASGLGSLRSEAAGAADALAESALTDPDPKVRGKALEALAMVAPKRPRLETMLLTATGDESPDIRLGAVRGLGRIQAESAVNNLWHLLVNDPDEAVRAMSAMALADIGVFHQDEGRFRKPITDPIPLVRIAVASLIVGLPEPPEDAPDLIFDNLFESRPDITMALLEKLGRRPITVVVRLIDYLDDPRPFVREASIRALAQIGANEFVSSLTDPYPRVRAAAARGLRTLGKDALQAAEEPLTEAAEKERDPIAQRSLDTAWFALQEARCRSQPSDKAPPKPSPGK